MFVFSKKHLKIAHITLQDRLTEPITVTTAKSLIKLSQKRSISNFLLPLGTHTISMCVFDYPRNFLMAHCFHINLSQLHLTMYTHTWQSTSFYPSHPQTPHGQDFFSHKFNPIKSNKYPFLCNFTAMPLIFTSISLPKLCSVLSQHFQLYRIDTFFTICYFRLHKSFPLKPLIRISSKQLKTIFC